MYRTIFIILLFVPILAAEETAEIVKKPARDSFREVFDIYQANRANQGKLPEGIQGQYIKLTVSPKTFSDPLLRYRLHILPGEYESGNAYPLIVEALNKFNGVSNRRQQRVLDSNESRSLGVDADRVKVNQLRFKAFPLFGYWEEKNRVPITAEEESSLFADLADVFKLLDKASRKRYYDWSDTFEPRGIATLLPNIQEFRNLMRYLSDKADWEIRNGKYDDAVKTIRVGYTLGRQLQNSSPSPILVTELVGISAIQMMTNQLQNLMNQPDAPNLYPALTQLYFSQETILNSLYAEQQCFIFPRFVHPDIYEKIDTATSEECKRVLDDWITGCIGIYPEYDSSMEAAIFQKESFTLSCLCLATYPAARQRLVDKGCTDEQIDALSTYQIVAPYVLETIQHAYDVMYVSASFLPGESHTAIKFDEQIWGNPSELVKVYLAMILPATESARSAFLLQTQMLDRLKIAEALRYYAFVHDGKLPQSLEEIKEVPVPKIDPVTGKPYIYKAEGNTATIDFTIHLSELSRMELKIEK